MTLFDGDLLALIGQYEDDIATYGRTGYVPCAACADRLMPTAHVVERLNELRARAWIHIDGDDGTERQRLIERSRERALADLTKHEAAIERALRP
jgi:hypothetical protein